MRQAPNYPTEEATAFPFSVAYAGTGIYASRSTSKIFSMGSHEIIAEIHVAKKDLPRGIESVVGYVDAFVDALQADTTLGGTVDRIESLSYSFEPMQWGATETIGYRFNLAVDIRDC